MEDKKIICKDCGKEFVFTVGEQEFYKEKGFDNEPVRCMDCRRARKNQNNRRELAKTVGFPTVFLIYALNLRFS
jgi:Probable zinc-ribbon domain